MFMYSVFDCFVTVFDEVIVGVTLTEKHRRQIHMTFDFTCSSNKILYARNEI